MESQWDSEWIIKIKNFYYSFFLFEDNKVICFDTTASGSDKYWCEEFPIKDYEYANKWLNGEIEYSDYLEQKNEEDIELWNY